MFRSGLYIASRLSIGMLAAIGLLFTLFILLGWLITRNDPEGLYISGKVVKAGTQEGIPRAHVIVTYWPLGFMVNKRSLGIIADDHGNFQIHEPILIDVTLGLEIHASGKGSMKPGEGDLYTQRRIEKPVREKDWITVDITLPVNPLDSSGGVPPGMRYETFCPLGVYPRQLDFIYSGWTLPEFPLSARDLSNSQLP